MKKILMILVCVIFLLFCAVPASSVAHSALAESAVTDSSYIYFSVPRGGAISWDKVEMIYCHLAEKSGGEIYSWQSNSEKCEKLVDGLWRYDMSSINFDPNGEYTVIFSDNKGNTTFSLCIVSDCLGDIAYCENYSTKGPSDSNKTIAIAKWKNHKDSVFPAIEKSSENQTVSLDGYDPEKALTKWGDSKGNSYDLSSIQLSTNPDDLTEQDVIADKEDGINLRAVTITIVAVSVIIFCALVVLTIKLAKRNRNNGK